MNVLSLFSGIGGFELGLERAGMTVVGQVEIDPFCQRVLAKHWPEVPRHDDVRTAVDWWLGVPRPAVDVVCGGFPCQPVSLAGRGLAQADGRWLWPAAWAVIAALRPSVVILENVPGLLIARRQEGLGDGCVCGRPGGWRGLHLRSQHQRREAVRRARRRRHDDEGGGAARANAWVVRRFGERHAQADREMGGGPLLGSSGHSGSRIPAQDRATPSSQSGTGTTGNTCGGHPGLVAQDVWRSRRVVFRGTQSMRDHKAPNPGAEPQGTGLAGTKPRILCPACGRRMGHRPGGPVFRSGLGDVLRDLAEIGYDAEWDCVPAAAVGAPHRRDRVFIVAHTQRDGLRDEPVSVSGCSGQTLADDDGQNRNVAYPDGFGRDRQTGAQRAGGRNEPANRCGTVADAESDGWGARRSGRPAGDGANGSHVSAPGVGDADRERQLQPGRVFSQERRRPGDAGWWTTEPDVGRVAHGVPARVDRLRALGNAVVPQVAEYVGRLVMAGAA